MRNVTWQAYKKDSNPITVAVDRHAAAACLLERQSDSDKQSRIKVSKFNPNLIRILAGLENG